MKKNYSLIGEWVKRNGISFLVSDGVCMDIKVEPNTEEVDFGDLYGIRLNFDCSELPATCSRRSGGFWSKTIFFPANEELRLKSGEGEHKLTESMLHRQAPVFHRLGSIYR